MEVTIQKLNVEQLKEKDVFSWSVWEKEESVFDWFYDSEEHCYFLEGEVIVETSKGEYKFGKGDYVTFQKGLSCKWKVLKKVKKHYIFL